jgi:hypothetical protein
VAEERLTNAEANKIRNDYNFILGLAANDTTGSIMEFWNSLRKVIKDSRGDQTIISSFVDRELPKQEYFMSMYGTQVETAIQGAQPEFGADVDRAVEKKRQDINALAERYGVQFPEGKSIDDFAKESWRNGWDNNEILLNMRPFLSGTLESGADVTGTAGGFRDELLQWSRRNGISLDNSAAAKYVANMTLGSQDLDSVKQDIRDTYLKGAYPAWSDRIAAGFDPSEIAAPYRQRMARLLEVDENDISLDDQLLQQAMQGVGSDGKPSVVPLYSFDRQIKQDDRWQYTENAMDTYAKVGTKLLNMFGLR